MDCPVNRPPNLCQLLALGKVHENRSTTGNKKMCSFWQWKCNFKTWNIMFRVSRHHLNHSKGCITRYVPEQVFHASVSQIKLTSQVSQIAVNPFNESNSRNTKEVQAFGRCVGGGGWLPRNQQQLTNWSLIAMKCLLLIISGFTCWDELLWWLRPGAISAFVMSMTCSD